MARKKKEPLKIVLAYDTNKSVSSRGTFLSGRLQNGMATGLGVMLPINGNPDQLYHVGQI